MRMRSEHPKYRFVMIVWLVEISASKIGKISVVGDEKSNRKVKLGPTNYFWGFLKIWLF